MSHNKLVGGLSREDRLAQKLLFFLLLIPHLTHFQMFIHFEVHLEDIKQH